MSIEVYIDGACSGNPGPAGIGIVIPELNISHKEYIGESTNNIAEATALLRALEILASNGEIREKVDEFIIYSDSQLICNHVNELWDIKDANLAVIYEEVHGYDNQINYELQYIEREFNKADDYAKAAVKERDSPSLINDNPRKEGTPENVTADVKFITASTKIPCYGIEHDPIERFIRVYEYHTNDDNRPLEGSSPDMIAEVTEELAIKLILGAKNGIISEII